MKNKLKTLRKSIAMLVLIAVVAVGSFGASATKVQALVAPNWNTTGNYVVNMNYLGTDYAHDMTLVQDGLGNLTGNGGSPAGAQVYTWVLTTGTVAGDAIDFLANYTATPDAVTPQTVLHVVGVVAMDGTMSGTWTDDYQGGMREGTWVSTTGNVVAILPVPPTTDGQIGGTVSGGVGTGVLSVTSIETIDASATADGTFANGWKYVFNITVPTNETNLAMKFDNWTIIGGGSTISAANNMRISSPQANNAGATILVTAANTYTIPTLGMVTDLAPVLEGIQVKVNVEVAVPAGSTNGPYTTNYGVKSN